MKKLLSLLLSMTLVFSLAACSGGTTSSGGGTSEPAASSSAPSSQTPSEPEAPSSSEASEESAEPAEETGGTLIAYFSWSGNTEQMAQMIQAETNGDLFEIEPATPYTDDYDTLLDVAQQEQADNARPELASQVESWDSYDVVFVGYPDWWSDAPMLIYSFLEAYDWEGKTLVPFCTSGGSGFGRSLDKLPESAQGATIAEGLHVSGSSVDGASEEIASWIDSLNVT
ncbi:MAG TPA: flavodoxin [Candidatus Gallacutalibacter stercoravium]|nr:flavodoxin [Candidatus Gallacutalibacter stercoravium]